MEIETSVTIEIDPDDFVDELDLDNRIQSGMEDFVIEAVKTAVEDQTYDLREHLRRVDNGTITEDRVREIVREIAFEDGYALHGDTALVDDRTRYIVREEITKSINGVGMVLASMIGPKENNNA